jgi:acyl-homoserine lactone acylase PvdQ
VRRLIAAAVTALLTVLVAATVAYGAAEPYQQNDYKGFWNILPPGENGFDNAAELAAFEAGGTRPAHNDDQLAKYGDLVHVAPNLKAEDIGKYFNDGSFGVKPDDVERTYSPRSDVTIVRDKHSGTGHVYGDTRSGTMFGAGYLAAEDRLFFIDVLRHVGRAQLSSFAGGSEGNRVMDEEQWSIAPYNEADLQRQYDQLDALYGAEGKQVQDDMQSYVDGINAYITEAKLNPSLLPGEYGAINQPTGPTQWKVTDIIATAGLVGGIFGKGGGRELASSLVLEEAQKRFGKKRGTKVWRDFRSQEDPEAPTTVHNGKHFNYMASPKKTAKGSLALPDVGTVKPVPIKVAEGSGGGGGGIGPIGGGGGGGGQTCLPGGILCVPPAMSNALVVGAKKSKSGHPLAVFGPQVGYFSPQILMDEDLHGPGVQARGAAFPGVNLYVELGRGPDYAWSATSAGQDIVDTYAVDLCNADGSAPTIDSTSYVYDGTCRPMEPLERDNSWVPSGADQTPPGSEKLVALRTALGIVEARATVGGQPVAYTVLRTTYMHEVDSARGFSDFNDPDKMKNPAEFQAAAAKIGYTFNWLYVDSKHDAYFNSGNNPVRPRGVNPNFPVRGKKEFVWKGFNPDAMTADYTPASQHPQAVDQDYLTSWNNKQAPGTRASDEQWGYSSVYRVDPLTNRIKHATRHGRKMSLVDLINAMEDAGTVDIRAARVLPYALKAIGKPKDAATRDAIAKLKAWVADGGHRRDVDNNGQYEHSEAIRILDAWWPLWIQTEFGKALGGDLYSAVQSMIPLDNAPNNHGSHLGSAYQDGWYGYASKDLRTILKKKVRGRYSRVYCGGGRPSRCRASLAASLKIAIRDDSAAKLYGGDAVCKKAGRDGDQKCFDSVMMRPLGAVTQPLIDWINRPTFQQAVEIPSHR